MIIELEIGAFNSYWKLVLEISARNWYWKSMLEIVVARELVITSIFICSRRSEFGIND